ncbi:MAG: hypothetical protein AAGA91_16320 [Pseudomonadota bacterium]
MKRNEALHPPTVQLEISTELLCRLLREGSLVASDMHCLNGDSHQLARIALKASVSASGPEEN